MEEQMIEKPNQEQKGATMPARAGGVYIPPFKLKKMLEELQTKED